jgi:hypothetical protein
MLAEEEERNGNIYHHRHSLKNHDLDVNNHLVPALDRYFCFFVCWVLRDLETLCWFLKYLLNHV